MTDAALTYMNVFGPGILATVLAALAFWILRGVLVGLMRAILWILGAIFNTILNSIKWRIGW